ncbi:hypothetical protein C0583_02090 [Candidatus Parcubacteria bacterium]|nr:MAG: hypothetical protein C0583_02090 [Candidatus Parcubacteria bacterium]
MIQQYIAITVIAYIIFRLYKQKKINNLKSGEFNLWLFFWMAILLVIIFIKKIDSLVAQLGFSSAGIDVLLYFSIAVLFYLYIKLRIKL